METPRSSKESIQSSTREQLDQLGEESKVTLEDPLAQQELLVAELFKADGKFLPPEARTEIQTGLNDIRLHFDVLETSLKDAGENRFLDETREGLRRMIERTSPRLAQKIHVTEVQSDRSLTLGELVEQYRAALLRKDLPRYVKGMTGNNGGAAMERELFMDIEFSMDAIVPESEQSETVRTLIRKAEESRNEVVGQRQKEAEPLLDLPRDVEFPPNPDNLTI